MRLYAWQFSISHVNVPFLPLCSRWKQTKKALKSRNHNHFRLRKIQVIWVLGFPSWKSWLSEFWNGRACTENGSSMLPYYQTTTDFPHNCLKPDHSVKHETFMQNGEKIMIPLFKSRLHIYMPKSWYRIVVDKFSFVNLIDFCCSFLFLSVPIFLPLFFISFF